MEQTNHLRPRNPNLRTPLHPETKGRWQRDRGSGQTRVARPHQNEPEQLAAMADRSETHRSPHNTLYRANARFLKKNRPPDSNCNNFASVEQPHFVFKKQVRLYF